MNFRERVYKLVSQIPPTKVASYGQIATLLGNPRAARQVGFALRSLGLNEAKIPWWRVVNKEGYISIDHGDLGMEKIIQKDILLSEGVTLSNEFTVNMQAHRWQPPTASE